MKPTLCLLVSLVVVSAARAELKWEQTEVELHPSPTDTEAVGHFKYTNTGDKPVHFSSVRTSCGCTTAKHKDVVAPGEAGEIAATFKIGGAIGATSKTVTVDSDDPAHPKTVLTLRAVITAALDVKPTFVFWNANEAPKAKTITVKAAKDYAVSDIKVTSTNAAFSIDIKPDGAGAYRVDVTPQNTTTAVNATLTIVPQTAQGAGKAVFATAKVTAASAAQ